MNTTTEGVIAMKMVTDKHDRITIDPEQMNGQPCIRGMRLIVKRVLEALRFYPDRAGLLAEYAELEEEDIRQALAFAAKKHDRLRHNPGAGRMTSRLLDQELPRSAAAILRDRGDSVTHVVGVGLREASDIGIIGMHGNRDKLS
jgi:uncharacterized protein (DUF433 family)